MIETKRSMLGTVTIALLMTIALAGSTLGQRTSTPQTVNAQQSGPWSVGIDPANNTVRLPNSDADPLAVKVVPANGRKPVQFRMFVGPTSTGQHTTHWIIPAGKRLVVENISVVARTPPGLKMALQLFSYFDSDGNGQGDTNDITFHRIPLIDQGTFGDFSVSSANLKVLIFADERIGTSTGNALSLQGQLNGTTTEFTQGQVTVSGYLEDLPQVP
jgi:hypothetical protein